MPPAERSAGTSAPILEAARLIRTARHLIAFMGAGISVESGIRRFSALTACAASTIHVCWSWTTSSGTPERAWEARGFLRTLLTQNTDRPTP